MMFHMQGASKHSCSLLAVVFGRVSDDKQRQDAEEDHGLRYPFPKLASSGRLEVQTLNNPSVDEFRKTVESLKPNVVYLQGEQLQNDEVGSLAWGGLDFTTAEAISELFRSTLPTTVYLEIQNGEVLAEAIHSKGIPYVIFWKNSISRYAAAHFRHALLLVIQSSLCHTWDAFHLAHASFNVFCIQNNVALPTNSQKTGGKLGPCLLGDPPSIDVPLPEMDAENDEDSAVNDLSALKIHDDDVSVRFLVCGVPCSLDESLLGYFEAGLDALLSIEIRGSKLHNRFSAPPPPLQAGIFSRGVVTMKCDMSTSSSAHISLLVSGSAQTCFDDHLLENHIKKEVIERSQLVHAVPISEENKRPFSEPRKSSSIAGGAPVFEVCMKLPSWALQVLRQLAREGSYRSLVALGIASIQGMAVASFNKDDAARLLFFCRRQDEESDLQNDLTIAPSWLKPPSPSRKRSEPGQGSRPCSNKGRMLENQGAAMTMYQEDKRPRLLNGVSMPMVVNWQKSRVAAMRPIPNTYLRKMMPFTGVGQGDGRERGQIKTILPAVPSTKHSVSGANPASYRKSSSNSYQAKQITLNPIPLKKHGCGRVPIQLCSEEEFLKDVMQFLILRGHTRLITQGGLAEFPDAILNSKRLDLYNLYREVVSRGGFHVGNGINWKGQVFSKMRNYTATNKMTGVGNTLKRHYETYLLEYELAHDDVDGECCLLCHSSAAGDWVNCGICGEWAHFGCDRRQGLGAFKDYAKTDGLEYICPHCSITNFKKKLQKPSNGFLEGLTYSRPV
ncbi:AT-rich interactive domain-containing protein 4 [Ancistrocladus abbreviatus]